MGKDTILWGNGGVPPHSPSPYSLYNFAAPHQTDSRVGEVGEISINTTVIVRKKMNYIFDTVVYFFFSTGSCPDGPSGTGIVPNFSCTSFFDFQLRWQP